MYNILQTKLVLLPEDDCNYNEIYIIHLIISIYLFEISKTNFQNNYYKFLWNAMVWQIQKKEKRQIQRL